MAVVACLTLGVTNANAALLSVDFDDDIPFTETPVFVSYAQGDQPNKTFSGITVAVSGEQTAVAGGFFDRGAIPDSGGFTYGDLYRDFVFHNAGGTLSFDISGLSADTPYEITWYLYDSAGVVGTLANRIQPRGGSNTTGNTIDATYVTGTALTSNNQFAVTGTWISTDTSLEIDVADIAGGDPEVRVNGFELDVRSSDPFIPVSSYVYDGAGEAATPNDVGGTLPNFLDTGNGELTDRVLCTGSA